MRPGRHIFAVFAAAFFLNGLLGWHSWQAGRVEAAPANAEKEDDDFHEYTNLFTKVIELIKQDYVDESKTDYKALYYAALRGMLNSLDPHSQFLDEDAFQETQKDTEGEFSGLGIVVGMGRDKQLTILAPIEDTPGGRAGLLPGDRILKIDGRTTEKMPLPAAIKLLRGSKGQKVRLTILRPAAVVSAPASPAPGTAPPAASNSGEILEFELTRETIKVTTVKEAKMLPVEIAGNEKVGFIRLEQFGKNTPDELENALVSLEKQGMQSLVLDLRNNPGGLLPAAVEVAGKFLPAGQMIVSTEGRNAQQKREFQARSGKRHPNYPIAVLVNGYSASGAEIVAGALKDLRRAVLIGETTFGKGSVQSVEDLGNGVGLRLTTAKYYTPSHRVIHEVGIEPDILAPVSDVEERQLMQQRGVRPLSPEEKLKLRDFRDTQLERAVAALKGIRIYNQRAQPPAAAPVKAN